MSNLIASWAQAKLRAKLMPKVCVKHGNSGHGQDCDDYDCGRDGHRWTSTKTVEPGQEFPYHCFYCGKRYAWHDQRG